MVKTNQVYRHKKTGVYILISGFEFYKKYLVVVLNKEHFLHKTPMTVIDRDSILGSNYVLVANNYQAK